VKAIRQIVDSEKLTSFMKIPEDMRHIEVEIIVLPLNQEKPAGPAPEVNHDALEKLFGSLHEYANPALIPTEKSAWEMLSRGIG
jgi:hypothetical protein